MELSAKDKDLLDVYGDSLETYSLEDFSTQLDYYTYDLETIYIANTRRSHDLWRKALRSENCRRILKRNAATV